MKINKFWAKIDLELNEKSGKTIHFPCWRGSNISIQDAMQKAKEASDNIRVKFAVNQKLEQYYPEGPLREQIISEIKNTDGVLIGVITRNRMGCEVLNSPNAFFIDIDVLAFDKKPGVFEKIKELFFKPDASHVEETENNEISKIRRILEKHQEWGLSIYRTFAGFRCLLTHDLFDPKSEIVIGILNEFGADPLYQRLCRYQESFRARLTPKPWRCKMLANKIRYPIIEDALTEKFDLWLEKYNNKSASFATCRLIGRYGKKDFHPDIKDIVKLHDNATKALQSELPLA